MEEPAFDCDTLQKKIRELEGSVLTDVLHRVEERSLDLRFKHWDGRSLAVHCGDVVLCNISVLDAKAGDSEVIGARADVLESGGREVLEKGGYLWEIARMREENISYPLFHLALDGDTCVIVICGGISVR